MRLLTRRFIGDYDPNLERSYSVSTVMDNDHFMLEILDSGGHHLEVLEYLCSSSFIMLNIFTIPHID